MSEETKHPKLVLPEFYWKLNFGVDDGRYGTIKLAEEMLSDILSAGENVIDILLDAHQKLPDDEKFSAQLTRDLLNEEPEDVTEILDNLDAGAYLQLENLLLNYLRARRKLLWESMVPQ